MRMTKQEKIEQLEAAEGRLEAREKAELEARKGRAVANVEMQLRLAADAADDVAQHLNRALATIRQEVLVEADRIV